jgi:L-seryl-tRNA(Ser) seleniumtransferase
MSDRRRALPSVDRLLRHPAVAALAADHPRTLVVRAVRDAIAAARAAPDAAPTGDAAWAAAVRRALARAAVPTLRPVINATGVVLHTNLGRAPLAEAALAAIAAAARGYGTLEYDVARGARGDRHVHCAGLLAELTGAEDALVVNNAASALVLALAAAAGGGEVIVSRGELIEIGGGFRIPEILGASGARLVEVGTTNRTRLKDYELAVGRGAEAQRAQSVSSRQKAVRIVPRAFLKVHRSNFRMEGFVEEAALEELVALGRRKRLPVIYDLGGGLMLELGDAGLGGEPTLPAAAQSGATAVIASGDKLLGGPQAGILVGRASFVARCRAHPFARAARADKLTLAGLGATLALYRDAALARREIPVLRMLTTPADALEARAQALAVQLPAAAGATVVRTSAAVGGGAFPGTAIPSAGVALAPSGLAPAALAERLRAGPTPVIAVVNRGRVVLDLRAVPPDSDAGLATAVREALG